MISVVANLSSDSDDKKASKSESKSKTNSKNGYMSETELKEFLDPYLSRLGDVNSY